MHKDSRPFVQLVTHVTDVS